MEFRVSSSHSSWLYHCPGIWHRTLPLSLSSTWRSSFNSLRFLRPHPNIQFHFTFVLFVLSSSYSAPGTPGLNNDDDTGSAFATEDNRWGPFDNDNTRSGTTQVLVEGLINGSTIDPLKGIHGTQLPKFTTVIITIVILRIIIMFQECLPCHRSLTVLRHTNWALHWRN